MTAPDRPERVDGVTDDTIKTEHAHKPNNQAGEHAANQLPAAPKLGADLRQQLAEALYQWTLSEAAPGGSRPPYLDPRTEQRLRENSAARADVCAAVVQPALDAKDAEIARLRTLLDRAVQGRTQAKRGRAAQWKRAEDAERELATLRTHQQTGDQP